MKYRYYCPIKDCDKSYCRRTLLLQHFNRVHATVTEFPKDSVRRERVDTQEHSPLQQQVGTVPNVHQIVEHTPQTTIPVNNGVLQQPNPFQHHVEYVHHLEHPQYDPSMVSAPHVETQHVQSHAQSHAPPHAPPHAPSPNTPISHVEPHVEPQVDPQVEHHMEMDHPEVSQHHRLHDNSGESSNSVIQLNHSTESSESTVDCERKIDHQQRDDSTVHGLQTGSHSSETGSDVSFTPFDVSRDDLRFASNDPRFMFALKKIEMLEKTVLKLREKNRKLSKFRDSVIYAMYDK